MTQRLRSKGTAIKEFTFSQASVGRLAMALHTGIRDHRLAIPDDKKLIDELVNIRPFTEISPNVYRLDHDPDRHDDRAIVISLGLLDLSAPSPQYGLISHDYDDDTPATHAPDGTPLRVRCLVTRWWVTFQMPFSVSGNSEHSPAGRTKPSPFAMRPVAITNPGVFIPEWGAAANPPPAAPGSRRGRPSSIENGSIPRSPNLSGRSMTLGRGGRIGRRRGFRRGFRPLTRRVSPTHG